MRFVIAIGFKADGTAEVLDCSTQPKASPDSVMRAFHAMRVEGSLPPGIASVKLIDSTRGQVGLALPRPGPSETETKQSKKSK